LHLTHEEPHLTDIQEISPTEKEHELFQLN